MSDGGDEMVQAVDERSFAPAVLARCLEILANRPAALLTDIDGTISEIAPRPEEAVVAERGRSALLALSRRLDLVGVVTGRSAAAAESLIRVPGLTYIGNHGLERIGSAAVWHHPLAVASADAVRAALVEIGEAVQQAGLDEGIIAEDKHLSASVHYRLAPDPVAAHGVVLKAAIAAAGRHGLRVTEGRLVVELRPMAPVNKGTAVVDLVNEVGLRSMIFLGDDLTDVDAFNAVRLLRENGEIRGLSVGVLAAETPEAVLAAADVTLPSVEACIALLCDLADRLGETSTREENA